MRAKSDICAYKEAIGKSFPQLEIKPIELDLRGWDNVVVLVNHEIVFRFPRQAEAAQKLEIENRLLPELRKCITLPIPHPEFIAQGFAGYRLIPGEPLTKELFQQIRSAELVQNLARQLAGFLSELHNFPPERAVELGVPHTPDKKLWTDVYEEIQGRVFPLLSPQEREWTELLFKDFLEDERNFQFAPVLVQGDLCPDHILFDRSAHQITGIIDFGDVRIGDPAYDFQLREVYGEEFWEEMLAHYRLRIDEGFFRRLEFYERRRPFHEVLYGLDCGLPKRVARAFQAMRQMMSKKKNKIQKTRVLQP